MKCVNCQEESPRQLSFCPKCGATQSGAQTDLSVHTSAPPESDLGIAPGATDTPSGIGVALDGPPDITDTQPSLPPPFPRTPTYIPQKERVQSWARDRALTHYEVLEVAEDASAAELTDRRTTLKNRLNQWVNHPTDGELRRLGSVGLRRLTEEMERDLSDRAAYAKVIRAARHQRALAEVRGEAQRYGKDGIIKYYEWKALKDTARDLAVDDQELEAIVAEQRQAGVLTGIVIAEHEARNLDELLGLCDGKPDRLLEVMQDDTLTRWLELCCERNDLAELVRTLRASYADNQILGAQAWLWEAGEQHLILKGASGETAVKNLMEWVDGVYNHGLEAASRSALADGRLEQWLRRALKRDDLGGHAAAAQAKGGPLGLWQLIWQTRMSGDEINKKAYSKTKELTRTSSGSVEVLYQHAIHSALVGQQSEMLEHLKRAAQQDREYGFRALREQSFQSAASEVRALLNELGLLGASTQPKKVIVYKEGQSSSLAEWVELCDRYPAESINYLYNGYMERWLADIFGQAALAHRARELTAKYTKQKSRGLELLVRAMCTYVGREAAPRIVAAPASVSLGRVPLGTKKTATLKLTNEGRGYAWGEVSIEPALPGVAVTASFDGLPAELSVTLDALTVQPRAYKGELRVQVEGVEAPFNIPLHYEVIPLQVEFEPAVLDFGSIPHGQVGRTALRVICKPAQGRLLGTATVPANEHAVTVTRRVDGAASELEVLVDTKRLVAGRGYKSSVKLATNAGEFEVPVYFKTKLRHDIVTAWTAGFSLATGLALWLCRAILAGADVGLNGRLTSYARPGQSNLTFVCAMFGLLLVALPLCVWGVMRWRKQPRRAKA
jgi:hypothetical protein